MKIQNYLKKFISWEEFNRADICSVAPLREVLIFKAAARRAGISFDDACKRLFEACYEKTAVTDYGGYPKYKLNKKIDFSLQN